MCKRVGGNVFLPYIEFHFLCAKLVGFFVYFSSFCFFFVCGWFSLCNAVFFFFFAFFSFTFGISHLAILFPPFTTFLFARFLFGSVFPDFCSDVGACDFRFSLAFCISNIPYLLLYLVLFYIESCSFICLGLIAQLFPHSACSSRCTHFSFFVLIFFLLFISFLFSSTT